MPTTDQSAVRNRLLRTMSPEDFALLAPDLVPCKAPRGTMLFRKDQPIETVWFIDSGIASIITVSAEGQRVESGLFGRDGFAPVALALGSDRTANDCLIQLPDDCFRIDAAALQAAFEGSRTLHVLLLRFAHALAMQTSYTALSNAIHPIEERLARWLLMCHDRIDGDDMPITHDFLSIMLAVRRPSVTTSLHVLEGNGFIRAERGCVIMRDRAALEAFAADGYGAPEREYERLIGTLR